MRCKPGLNRKTSELLILGLDKQTNKQFKSNSRSRMDVGSSLAPWIVNEHHCIKKMRAALWATLGYVKRCPLLQKEYTEAGSNTGVWRLGGSRETRNSDSKGTFLLLSPSRFGKMPHSQRGLRAKFLKESFFFFSFFFLLLNLSSYFFLPAMQYTKARGKNSNHNSALLGPFSGYTEQERLVEMDDLWELTSMTVQFRQQRCPLPGEIREGFRRKIPLLQRKVIARDPNQPTSAEPNS